MATGIDTVREQLETILWGIEGVETVARYTPPDLADAHCPIYIIVPARAEHEYHSFNDYRTVRRWRIILLVGRVLQSDYGALSEKLDPFYERTENAFITSSELDGIDAQIYDAGIVDDEGEAVKEWPPNTGKRWVGTEWGVEVDMSRRVTYQP